MCTELYIFCARRSGSYSNSEDGFSDGERREARGNSEGGDAKAFELFEPFSPVNSPDHLFDLSDEEILPTKRVCSDVYVEESPSLPPFPFLPPPPCCSPLLNTCVWKRPNLLSLVRNA